MSLKNFIKQSVRILTEIFKRFGNEQLILKFVKSFEKDKSFSELCEGFEEKDIEKAFRAAHTLKGVSVNLGFSELLCGFKRADRSIKGKNLRRLLPSFREGEGAI